jgi:septal ring factor EnvC (AmiA/AmiB activator)
MSFNYQFTCPTIDEEIGVVKDKIYSTIKNLLEGVNGEELSEEIIKDIASDYELHLYCDVEDSFEKVRQTNIDMRTEADYQIGERNEQLCELRDLIEDLRDQLKEKELDVYRLDKRIEELQCENEELNAHIKDLRDLLYQI